VIRRRLAAWALPLLLAAILPTMTEGAGAVAEVGSAGEPAPLGPPLSGAALDRATEEVSSLMRCPVCQGLSVADSPASSAVDLKAEVRRQLALGYTRDQVLASFERSYGEFIRLEPKAQGFNWLVWLAPMIAFAAGVLVIYLRLRPVPAQTPVPSAKDWPSS
jgi:cytochrome c-type biogenesis protein CcmH